MKGIVSAALFTLVAAPTFLLFNQPAKAQRAIYCSSGSQSTLSNDAGYHVGAYADGYREGRQSYRNGDSYQPRSAGGAFGIGFRDGYYGRPYGDRRYVASNRRDRECYIRDDRRQQRDRYDRRQQRDRYDDRYDDRQQRDRYDDRPNRY